MSSKSDSSRRSFIKRTGGGVPTLAFMLQKSSASPPETKKDQTVSDKFVPVDITRHFTATPADFGPRDRAKGLSRETRESGLISMPRGKHVFRGIPFLLGPEETTKKCWIALSSQTASWSTRGLEIPLGQKAGFLCLAQFCDWDPNERPAPGEDLLEKVGQVLAEAVLVYGDGSEQRLPIRRRFEVSSPSIDWGHLCFQAVPHRSDVPTKLNDPLRDAQMWGDLQCGVWESDYSIDPALTSSETLWLCALKNPSPDRTLKSLRVESRDADPLVICGLTLFQGRENPLRYERLSLYRITVPEANAADAGRWKVSVDLGVVARTSVSPAFEPEAWLAQPRIGLGDDAKSSHETRHIYAEVAASSEATLWLDDSKTGKRYLFELAKAIAGGELPAKIGGGRVELLEREKAWIH